MSCHLSISPTMTLLPGTMIATPTPWHSLALSQQHLHHDIPWHYTSSIQTMALPGTMLAPPTQHYDTPWHCPSNTDTMALSGTIPAPPHLPTPHYSLAS
ncbi:hypothetical protein Pcinc_038211 [Petrolisthes cinctipes]|uniref:Uncharacterized protein n=1 Tax=Petrolisthes cinctipes TaxID=88211 RepID=A0AAE1BR72_PETCI|nr:hypothetical protein Pcinc_038211 [Petrolisthes cinctipes]